MPRKKTGQAKLLISTEKPKKAISHAVTVVPMLAPIITLMAWASVSRPALTKLTVRTVVAVEDWTAAVTNVPVSKPVKRLRVIAPMILRRWPPASFWSDSLITFMPYISRARHPKSFKKERIVIRIQDFLITFALQK